MEPLPRSRLGTQPPSTDDNETDAPTLGLSVRLDRPFHELKEFLLAEFERAYVTRCLTESEMNVSMASRTSGLSRKHLRTLMAKYGIRRYPVNDVSDMNDVHDVNDVQDDAPALADS